MKAIKLFVTMLVLVCGCYVSAYADSFDVNENEVALSSKIIGKYPQITGMDSINEDIKRFITAAVIEMANHRNFYNQTGADKIFGYRIEYNGDVAKLQLFINKPLGIFLKSADKKDYYINTMTNTLTTEEAYNSKLKPKAKETRADELLTEDPIALSSIYYYRLRDIANYLGYELNFHPSEGEMPSFADIVYTFEDEGLSYPTVVATVYSASSLVLCNGVFFDIEYPVEHLDNYIYIPSTLFDWLVNVLFYDEK